MVLSACSPYFEDLFLSFTASSPNFNPSQSQFVVCLKDTSFEDAVLLVEFMYRGEINVPQHRIHSLLKVRAVPMPFLTETLQLQCPICSYIWVGLTL